VTVTSLEGTFCGTIDGPFLEVGGGLPLLMCPACQAARGRGAGNELLAAHDPGQPELQWTCALCPCRCFIPTWLEDHTAAEHPGWTARFEVVRPYPRQVLRVVYRRSGDSGSDS
jgi:hypothetical protein